MLCAIINNAYMNNKKLIEEKAQNNVIDRINPDENVYTKYNIERWFMEDKKNNSTKYGEQVCSEFAWLPLDKQKEKAKKFAKVTKTKKRKK